MAMDIFANPFAKGKDTDKAKKGGAKSKPVTAKSVREAYDRGTKALRKEQWTYVINKSFVIDNEQWVRYDKTRNTIRPFPREGSRVQATLNRLWPISRHLMSKLLSRPLVFEVPPGEADDASIRGARTAEAVLADLQREHVWEDVREQLAWNTWLGGTGVLAVEWDGTQGPTIGHTEFGAPFGTGEIQETPLSILEVAWEPGTQNAETGYWWVRAQALPPCEVATTYDLAEEPKADATAAQGYLGRSLSMDNLGSAPPVDLTLVLTYYERPNPKRPQGAVCTVVGDKIVDGPHAWPFPWDDHLNMVVFRETKVTGKASGHTVLSAAVPVQVAFNSAWSNLIEHLKLSGNTRLWVPDGSLDGIDELSDLPAELVAYNASGGKPSWESPPSLPNWIVEHPRMLAKEMDDILGSHEISRGQAPEGIESGVGLSVLIEQDTTPLGAMTREMAFGFERFGCMVLELYAANVKETRQARIRTAGNTPEVTDWTGESLAGQTVATIPMDSIMPRSRTALMAFAKEMWDREIIPHNNPQMFARLADVPSQEYLIEAMDEDIAKAERENRRMATGRPSVPAKFDLHDTHIKCHNKFRKTLRYETLSREDQERIDDHIQAHEIMAAEQMGTQVAKTNVSPALAAVPTAAAHPQLPPNMLPGTPPGNVPADGSVPVTLAGGPPAQPEPNENLSNPQSALVPESGEVPS